MKKHTAKITSKSIEQSGLPSDFKKAIAEYIWNGFDANASTIELNFDANAVGYINSFSISDNGSGINLGRIEDTFGEFMDSQKTKLLTKTDSLKVKREKVGFHLQTLVIKQFGKQLLKVTNQTF